MNSRVPTCSRCSCGFSTIFPNAKAFRKRYRGKNLANLCAREHGLAEDDSAEARSSRISQKLFFGLKSKVRFSKYRYQSKADKSLQLTCKFHQFSLSLSLVSVTCKTKPSFKRTMGTRELIVDLMENHKNGNIFVFLRLF